MESPRTRRAKWSPARRNIPRGTSTGAGVSIGSMGAPAATLPNSKTCPSPAGGRNSLSARARPLPSISRTAPSSHSGFERSKASAPSFPEAAMAQALVSILNGVRLTLRRSRLIFEPSPQEAGPCGGVVERGIAQGLDALNCCFHKSRYRIPGAEPGGSTLAGHRVCCGGGRQGTRGMGAEKAAFLGKGSKPPDLPPNLPPPDADNGPHGPPRKSNFLSVKQSFLRVYDAALRLPSLRWSSALHHLVPMRRPSRFQQSFSTAFWYRPAKLDPKLPKLGPLDHRGRPRREPKGEATHAASPPRGARR